MSNICKICGESCRPVFTAMVMGKYPVTYFQCDNCSFIQTEDPYWLSESYSSAITFLDIGLLDRNIYNAEILNYIINISFNPDGNFIDYAGGYGILVRMMRDKGYNFLRQDIYCENLFAKTFDVTDNHDLKDNFFELLTAFEVFEHLENPQEEIKKMLTYSNSILFSTELQPETSIKDANDWWYIVPETGQHIAFYTEKSLKILAAKFGLQYYKITNTLHLFSDKKINIKKIIAITSNGKLRFLYRKLAIKKRHSLIQKDFNKLIGRKVF